MEKNSFQLKPTKEFEKYKTDYVHTYEGRACMVRPFLCDLSGKIWIFDSHHHKTTEKMTSFM